MFTLCIKGSKEIRGRGGGRPVAGEGFFIRALALANFQSEKEYLYAMKVRRTILEKASPLRPKRYFPKGAFCLWRRKGL